MSLKGIQNSRENIVFGNDLSVINGDTYITGDLNILGTITGTSAQGQNTNNVWTGTNEYSVYRPTSLLTAVNANDGVSQTNLEQSLLSASIINAGDDFTGENTFNQVVVTNQGLTPTNNTDAINGKYLIDSWNAKSVSYLSTNNTWSGTNTFQNQIPTGIEPINNTDGATKNYVDTQTESVAIGSTETIISQNTLTGADWGNYRAVELQLIGGGGGSTSSVGSNDYGVAGGSGSQASLFVLTSSALNAGSGLPTNLSTYNISVGSGGKAGVGCGTGSNAGNGGVTTLQITPKSGNGFDTTTFNLIRCNGGLGFQGSCGDKGTAKGGIYNNSSGSPNLVQPLSKSNGIDGTNKSPATQQYYGINRFGWGASANQLSDGKQGQKGGYGATFYKN